MRHQLAQVCEHVCKYTYVELLSEELAVVGRSYPVLVLQGVERDGEVPLRWRGGSGQEDHCLLACAGMKNTVARMLMFPHRGRVPGSTQHLEKQA